MIALCECGCGGRGKYLHETHEEKLKRRREYLRQWRASRDKDTWRWYIIKNRYGLTRERYEEILAGQGGGCAICGRVESSHGAALAVDHDKETGIIRGILCNHCNQGIGLLEHDSKRLHNASAYLANNNDYGKIRYERGMAKNKRL
jgi:hypothetical protein